MQKSARAGANASEASNGSGSGTSSGSCEVDRYLSAEEREVWLGLGQTLPVRVPFSKAEERILKRVRRKIKNKVRFVLVHPDPCLAQRTSSLH